MRKETKNRNPERHVIYILLIIFILTEVIDLLLDQSLGNSVLHSVIQLILFLSLFVITYRLFVKYSSKKIKKLIPEELMKILEIIKNEKTKGILINQKRMRDTLDITKPTLKKRIDALIALQYISFEEKGNHRYFILTYLGDSISN
jgi:hypothetical protein